MNTVNDLYMDKSEMAESKPSRIVEMADSNPSTTVGPKIFTLVLWTTLSIAMVVSGSMHVGNCPREPNIPIYLIVAGAFHLLGFCLIPLKKPAEKLTYALESIIGLFSFCWFIAGSVWVFRIYPDDPRACNDLVYKCAFGILIFEYIFIALVLFSVCLCTCCAGCLAFSGATGNDNQ